MERTGRPLPLPHEPCAGCRGAWKVGVWAPPSTLPRPGPGPARAAGACPGLPGSESQRAERAAEHSFAGPASEAG